jgi:hypothetical protein
MGGLLAVSLPSVAFAAPAPKSSSVTVQKSRPRAWSLNHRPPDGLAFEIGRELHWARMTLLDDLPFLANGQTLAPILPLSPGALDPHQLLARPRAMGSMGSAMAQLVLRVSSFELWKQGRLWQRHHFRPYVGMTGFRVTWRIDF